MTTNNPLHAVYTDTRTDLGTVLCRLCHAEQGWYLWLNSIEAKEVIPTLYAATPTEAIQTAVLYLKLGNFKGKLRLF